LTATGAIEIGEAKRVRAQLTTAAAKARFLATALELRAAVTAAFTAMEEHQQLSDDSLGTINAILAADAGVEQLSRRDGGYRVDRRRELDDPKIALVPIARDIARLLATPDAPVRHCAGDGCVRHFYDDSRTGRRRWCEMSICGNRAKASAFAKRQRAAR
jgi:predicted RNA-binding Zn ribbon-like protein